VEDDEKWQLDRYFVQRRLAGQCPYFIKLVVADKGIIKILLLLTGSLMVEYSPSTGDCGLIPSRVIPKTGNLFTQLCTQLCTQLESEMDGTRVRKSPSSSEALNALGPPMY